MTNPASAKISPLGRGLAALLGDKDSSYQPTPMTGGSSTVPASTVTTLAVNSAVEPNERVMRIVSITSLQPNPQQPRRYFDDTRLKELADSIRARGVLEPLVARPAAGQTDRYEIVAGERRWRASQLAGLHEVPVIIRTLTDLEALEFGLIENIQRQDLSPIEEAEGFRRLLDEFGYTHEMLAKIVGKSGAHVSNMVRLLNLPQQVQQMVTEGKLSYGHARALVPVPDAVSLAQEIIARGLNVRQAEAMARVAIGEKRMGTGGRPAKKPPESDADIMALERELERLIGIRVKIIAQGAKGALTLYYENLDQLDDVIKRLRS